MIYPQLYAIEFRSSSWSLLVTLLVLQPSRHRHTRRRKDRRKQHSRHGVVTIESYKAAYDLRPYS